MNLDDNYRIVRDAHSWNLVSLKNRNKTQYHPNLKQALLAYLHMCLKPPVTVQHILKAISEAEQRIADMVAGSNLDGAPTPKGKEGGRNG
jgi:hypothetical protein